MIYQSGDLDLNCDVRDAHSLYVHDGELPLDTALLSLPSKVITRMARGGERQPVLAIKQSPDPLPIRRPSTTPAGGDCPKKQGKRLASSRRRQCVQGEHLARRLAEQYCLGMRYTVEIDQETDGRWIAEVVDLPGVMAYGETRGAAIAAAEALAFRVLADKLEHGELNAGALELEFGVAAA